MSKLVSIASTLESIADNVQTVREQSMTLEELHQRLLDIEKSLIIQADKLRESTLCQSCREKEGKIFLCSDC